MLNQVRRIVTAIGADGRSYIAEAGPSPAAMTIPALPGFANHNIWRTTDTPASLAEADSIASHRGVLPPHRGTVVRIVDIPPDPTDSEVGRRLIETVFDQIYADARRDADHAGSPGMHTTDTIDYAIMISGELVAVMEEGEAVVRPGDVLIQRGTAHAWRNRSDAVARIAFVLIDGAREPDRDGIATPGS